MAAAVVGDHIVPALALMAGRIYSLHTPSPLPRPSRCPHQVLAHGRTPRSFEGDACLNDILRRTSVDTAARQVWPSAQPFGDSLHYLHRHALHDPARCGTSPGYVAMIGGFVAPARSIPCGSPVTVTRQRWVRLLR